MEIESRGWGKGRENPPKAQIAKLHYYSALNIQFNYPHLSTVTKIALKNGD